MGTPFRLQRSKTCIGEAMTSSQHMQHHVSKHATSQHLISQSAVEFNNDTNHQTNSCSKNSNVGDNLELKTSLLKSVSFCGLEGLRKTQSFKKPENIHLNSKTLHNKFKVLKSKSFCVDGANIKDTPRAKSSIVSSQPLKRNSHYQPMRSRSFYKVSLCVLCGYLK